MVAQEYTELDCRKFAQLVDAFKGTIKTFFPGAWFRYDCNETKTYRIVSFLKPTRFKHSPTLEIYTSPVGCKAYLTIRTSKAKERRIKEWAMRTPGVSSFVPFITTPTGAIIRYVPKEELVLEIRCDRLEQILREFKVTFDRR